MIQNHEKTTRMNTPLLRQRCSCCSLGIPERPERLVISDKASCLEDADIYNTHFEEELLYITMVLFEHGMPRNVDNLESMILWMVPPQLSAGYNLIR